MYATRTTCDARQVERVTSPQSSACELQAPLFRDIRGSALAPTSFVPLGPPDCGTAVSIYRPRLVPSLARLRLGAPSVCPRGKTPKTARAPHAELRISRSGVVTQPSQRTCGYSAFELSERAGFAGFAGFAGPSFPGYRRGIVGMSVSAVLVRSFQGVGMSSRVRSKEAGRRMCRVNQHPRSSCIPLLDASFRLITGSVFTGRHYPRHDLTYQPTCPALLSPLLDVLHCGLHRYPRQRTMISLTRALAPQIISLGRVVVIGALKIDRQRIGLSKTFKI